MSQESGGPFPAGGAGQHEGVLERSSDAAGGAVRLTFPVGAAGAELNAMVLAGGAEGLELEPEQAAGLGLAVATESAAAMSRQAAGQSGQISVELDFEPDRRQLRVTAAERTATTTTCEFGDGRDWSRSRRVEPPGDLIAEFAGSTFLRCILPRVLARVALSADACLDAVMGSTALADLVADAVLGQGSEPQLEFRVQAERESLEIAIRSPSERVLSAIAAVWPAAAESHGSGADTTLLLRTRIPVV